MGWWIFGAIIVLLVLYVPIRRSRYRAFELAILIILMERESLEGRELLSILREEGFWISAHRFYKMMARLEDASIVKRWEHEKIIDGTLIIPHCFRLGEHGLKRLFERLVD